MTIAIPYVRSLSLALTTILASFLCLAAMADDKNVQKPAVPVRDWTSITLNSEFIKGELTAIHDKIVKKEVAKTVKKGEGAEGGPEHFNRSVVVEHKVILADLIKNPDLEEASICSKKWFIAIYNEIVDMDSSIDKMDAAITSSSAENYAAALVEFEKKRLALKSTLANPIKLTKDQYEAVREANEKRRAKYAEQLKKSQGK